MSLDATFEAASRRYGVPVALLKAVGTTESGLNPKQGDSRIAPAVGTERATGMMQIKPSTARELGIDPNDPNASIMGAAAYLAQGHQKYGNWDDAVRYYHGGPNTKNWGNRTAGHHDKTAATVAQLVQNAPQNETASPFDEAFGEAHDAAPQEQAPPSAFDAAFEDANGVSEGSGNRVDSRNPVVSGPTGNPNRNPGNGDVRGNAGRNEQPARIAEAIANEPGNGFMGISGNVLPGVIRGATGVLDTGMQGLEWGLNKLGIEGPRGPASYQRSGIGDALKRRVEGLAQDPNSGSFELGKIGGEVMALPGLGEINLFRAKPVAEGVAETMVNALKRYGNFGAQGATFGAATSEGQDVGKNMALGAATGAGGGAAVEKAVLPVLSKVAQSKIAARLLAMMKGGSTEAEVRQAAADMGVALDNNVAANIASKNPKVRGANAPIADALDARTGIRGTADMPAPVQQHYDRLTSQGVGPKEALREADILNVPGAKPTVAAVTRNPADQRALIEGAKLDTPEGQALSMQLAQNNAALHNKVAGLVEQHGGVPGQGEAAQTAAASLAKASDAERAAVSAKYKAAQAANDNIEAALPVTPLTDLLNTPAFKAPTNAESRQLISGMRRLINEMSKANGGRFTPSQLEELRQASNQAYNKMGGGVNDTVTKINSAIDHSLDMVADVSPLYKEARAAHKAWASKYANPKGVSSLIRRDAQGNFLNEDNWRAAEGFVSKTADRDFVQIVRQLKANGDEQALARLKANIIQRAYERAGRTAADQSGNATFNGRIFLDHLNQIGMTKLEALFSKAEIADLASTGRAAIAMNEPVTGAANTSNTSSALLNALANRNAKPRGLATKVAKAGAHLIGGHVAPGAANLAIEAVDHATGAATSRSSAKKLAAALSDAMSPEAARASAKAEAKRLADAVSRRRVTAKTTRAAIPVATEYKREAR